jgi:3,4-dihydroxy 2-butanone 4-phosphate synthase/GTP cyclohydrolase II
MFDPIEDVVAAVRRGEMVVVLDDESRENEGDLVLAADSVTPAAVNFMATHGRGLICTPITASRAAALGLEEMAPTRDRFHTAFTVSVDASCGVTTGISAADRARTISVLASTETGRDDLAVPGHVFPLIARDGGVLARAGHTEAAIDLARMAGRAPVGVICEIMRDDGAMARRDDLRAFADEHELVICSIADLVAYRREREPPLRKTGMVQLPTRYAERPFDLHCYVAAADGREHMALVYGDVADREGVLVRVHSECLTGDIFHSARCDCGDQLEKALQSIVEEGSGVLVYLRQEGRGIGLIKKIEAYVLQDQGLDTVEANERLGFPADARDYSVAAQILSDLSVDRFRLLTNNPDKVSGINGCGLQVSERLPLVIPPKAENAFYLKTKRERLGHLL